MKKLFSLITVCLLMTGYIFADFSKDEICCNKCVKTISNKIPQAYVAQKFDPGSKPIIVVADEPFVFNFIFKNSEIFELDKKTGTLTLKKSGVYTVSFFTFLQLATGTSSTRAFFGIYATLNGKIIPTSSTYKNSGTLGTLASNAITFRAECGDTFNVVSTFNTITNQPTTPAVFEIPPGPSTSSVNLTGPITKVDWSPNFYEIIYCGN